MSKELNGLMRFAMEIITLVAQGQGWLEKRRVFIGHSAQADFLYPVGG